jgi:hypothetical protein
MPPWFVDNFDTVPAVRTMLTVPRGHRFGELRPRAT